MDTQKMTREQISALADGELADEHIDVALQALRQPNACAEWEIYHRIGDMLRSDDMALTMSPGFSARMAARLEMESTIVARPRTPTMPNRTAGMLARARSLAAGRRWALPGMAAAAAAAAAAAFIATPQLMVAVQGNPTLSNDRAVVAVAGQGDLAKAPIAAPVAEQVAAVTASGPNGTVLRDARIDDYLLAHQRFSPSMYSSAQFARSATFETAPGK